MGINVYGTGDASEQRWIMGFSAPSGQPLQVGTEYVVTGSFTEPRMFVFGDGSCSDLGRFTVRELVFNQNTFTITRLAIDFEHHCDTPTSPALTGSLQYNSTIDMPAMALDRSALRFAATINGGRFGSVTAPQIVRLTQAGAGTVPWSATPSVPWITVTPWSGIGSAALTVSVALAAGVPLTGTVQGAITFTAVGSKTALSPVGVTLTTLDSVASRAPFGSFDTPLDNSTAGCWRPELVAPIHCTAAP